MPKQEYSEKLDTILEECRAGLGITGSKVRLIIYGGELDDPKLLEAVEAQGALVVGDYLGSFGARAFESQAGTAGDLLHNLAYALLMGRKGEPRIHGTRASRSNKVKLTLEESHAQGIIMIHLPICDYWSYERMMFDIFAKKEGLPTLSLDTEYVFADSGQAKTRIQAFVETLKEGGR
jgi:benzoyl-CoA reductase/2-hydroxyglutaryl-CoA dehydratase subunit BcrC/BadD/HgdB